MKHLKVTALAGGVGGAKLARGLALQLPAQYLTIIVNTGDDFEHLGLRICPDIDTVLYTLAGVANPRTGWGRQPESWNAFDTLTKLGGPDWFRLGDRDIGLHLTRTYLLAKGMTLSQVTRFFCQSFKVKHTVLPVTDDPVPTMVRTVQGLLPFQEYFVHQQCAPEVLGFEFAGCVEALPSPGVLDAIEQSDAIILCPSNPWVSIDPILAIPGMFAAVTRKPIIAVSPIVGGKALKGPAAKMFAELGIEPSAKAVANHYRPFIRGFVLDNDDQAEQGEISQWGIIPYVTDVIMKDQQGQQRLAGETLAFAEKLLGG